MRTNAIGIVRFCGAGMLALLAGPLHAVGLQIPQISGCSVALGGAANALVKITARADALHAGTFQVLGRVSCTPPNFAGGQMSMTIDMNDSQVQGSVTFTSFDSVVSTGKQTPTLYMSGQCKASGVTGCRYWLFMTDNGKPDVAGFLLLDGHGERVAYGSGGLATGDITVSPAP